MENNRMMIQMEYCTDGDLQEYIEKKKNDKMTMDEIMDLFVQMCRGIRYCHDKKVIHRDLKVRF